MRWQWTNACAAGLCLALLSAATATAQGEQPDGAAPVSWTYVAGGAEWSYVSSRGPLPERQLGAMALADLALARGDRTAVRPPLYGDIPDGLWPPGWPAAGVLGPQAARGRAPLGVAEGGRCACATEIVDGNRERSSLLLASRAFSVADEIDRVRVLEVRSQYLDGVVVHINGREVARSNVADGSGGSAPATRRRGPQWETFLVPVTAGLLRRGTNVVAVEVRPVAGRRGPQFDLELVGFVGGRIVRGPIVQRVTPTSATILFDSDTPVRGAVELRTPEGTWQPFRSADGALARHHRVSLTGLAPGAAVRYRISAGGDLSAEYGFHTTPSTSEPLRFVVYGDMRGGHSVHGQIVESILDESPDLVIATGDVVQRGSDEADWQQFFDVAGDLLARAPFYTVVGNHDLGRAGDERRQLEEILLPWPAPPGRYLGGRWHSFDAAGVHFVMLDSNSYDQQEQLTWLDADLAAARQRGVRAIFAVVHHGPFSRGVHGGNSVAVEQYVPVLQRAGVSMIFSGHDHLYQRGRARGLDYVVSGGGGAPLYSVRCGVAGRSRCSSEDGMQAVARAYHYVLVTVFSRHIEVCAKRPDRSPLEPCVRLRLSGTGATAKP